MAINIVKCLGHGGVECFFFFKREGGLCVRREVKVTVDWPPSLLLSLFSFLFLPLSPMIDLFSSSLAVACLL